MKNEVWIAVTPVEANKKGGLCEDRLLNCLDVTFPGEIREEAEKKPIRND